MLCLLLHLYLISGVNEYDSKYVASSHILCLRCSCHFSSPIHRFTNPITHHHSNLLPHLGAFLCRMSCILGSSGSKPSVTLTVAGRRLLELVSKAIPQVTGWLLVKLYVDNLLFRLLGIRKGLSRILYSNISYFIRLNFLYLGSLSSP